MRKGWLILLAFLLSASAFAQNLQRIREDPSVVWAEGHGSDRMKADEEALDGLVRVLSSTDALPFPDDLRLALWRTYLADIRKCSRSVSDGAGTVIRYIGRGQIPEIFAPRRRKVRELYDHALQAARKGDAARARTYCDWAQAYLSSLPQGDGSPHAQVASLAAELGRGERATVPLRNVEREVALIRNALRRPSPTPPAPGAMTPVPKTPPRPAAGQGQAPVRERLALVPPSPVPMAPVVVLPAPASRLRALDSRPLQSPVLKDLPWEWSLYGLVDAGLRPSFGFRLAVLRGRMGGYVSGSARIPFRRPSYACSGDGTTAYGQIWTSGKAAGGRTAVSAGAVWRLSGAWSLYAGGGYGDDSVLWEDTAGQWARVADLSEKGLLAEAGFTWRTGHFSLSAGLSSIRLSRCSVVLGAGWTF